MTEMTNDRLTITTFARKNLPAYEAQFIITSHLRLIEWFDIHKHGRQSVVKIGGPKRGGGLEAKPPEAKGYYRIKFEF